MKFLEFFLPSQRLRSHWQDNRAGSQWSKELWPFLKEQRHLNEKWANKGRVKKSLEWGNFTHSRSKPIKSQCHLATARRWWSPDNGHASSRDRNSLSLASFRASGLARFCVWPKFRNLFSFFPKNAWVIVNTNKSYKGIRIVLFTRQIWKVSNTRRKNEKTRSPAKKKGARALLLVGENLSTPRLNGWPLAPGGGEKKNCKVRDRVDVNCHYRASVGPINRQRRKDSFLAPLTLERFLDFWFDKLTLLPGK